MKVNKDISFEEAIATLEDSLAKLECGELTLDASMEEFEEAVKLVKICTEKLEAAKQKVRILTEGADGAITDSPFVLESNET